MAVVVNRILPSSARQLYFRKMYSKLPSAQFIPVLMFLVWWGIQMNSFFLTNLDGFDLTPASGFGASLRTSFPESQHPTMKEQYPDLLDPSRYMDASGCDFSQLIDAFAPDDLEISCRNIDQLKQGDRIGKGSWRNAYNSTWKGRDVVIKTLRPKKLHKARVVEHQLLEAAVLYHLRDAPNVIGLVGWCNMTVVLERGGETLGDMIFDKDQPISVERALELAVQVMKGIAQVHASPLSVAHNDIWYNQFLVVSHGQLLLNDFDLMGYTGPCRREGYSRCWFQHEYETWNWGAPEEKAFDWLDGKVDIYRAAFVLWSLRAREGIAGHDD